MPTSDKPGEASRGRPLALTHRGGMMIHQPSNSLADRHLGPAPGRGCRGLARVKWGHQGFKKRKMERERGRKMRDKGERKAQKGKRRNRRKKK